MPTGNTVMLNEAEFREAVDLLDDAEEAFGTRWLKNTMARRAKKHFVPDMKRSSPSDRIRAMIGVTTAKSKVGAEGAIRVGVYENDEEMFPTFSAPALASVLEYGTEERFRQVQRFGVVTGRVSTGSVSPQPYLRPGYDKNLPGFLVDMEDSIERKFDKETR